MPVDAGVPLERVRQKGVPLPIKDIILSLLARIVCMYRHAAYHNKHW